MSEGTIFAPWKFVLMFEFILKYCVWVVRLLCDLTTMMYIKVAFRLREETETIRVWAFVCAQTSEIVRIA